jgi:hypothetical protein
MNKAPHDNDQDQVPTFVGSFWESVNEAYLEIGFRAYIPWLLFLLCFVPNISIYFLDVGDEPSISNGEITTILSAFAVVAGVLAAFSISAMTQVQQIASTFPFSDYLKQEKLLNSFIFFPQFTFAAQTLLIILNCSSVVFCSVFDKYNFEVLIVNFGFLLYVSFKTFGLVDLIRKLTWHFAEYNILLNR